MALIVSTQIGEGDWRPRSLLPRCALCILAMLVIIPIVIIMSITKSFKFVDILLLCFVAVSLCWNAFFLIRPKFHASLLHPGWAVGLDLICFPLIATWSIIGVTQGFATYEYLGTCVRYDVLQKDECKTPAWVQALGWIAYIGAFFMVIIHFVLFVTACRDIHRYNREKRDYGSLGVRTELSNSFAKSYSDVDDPGEHNVDATSQP